MIRWLKEMLRVWLRRAALASTSGVLKSLGDLERRKQAKVYPWDKRSHER
jgi:hypothetical protein